MTEATFALFVVGEPGSGKTTLVRHILGSLNSPSFYLNQDPKWSVAADFSLPRATGAALLAAGHYTGSAFDGADTVPYNGVVKALAWLGSDAAPKHRLAIFDGDRFSHAGALATLRLMGYTPVCVYLNTPVEVAAGRRAERAQEAGSKLQNASWVKGRATKAERFFDSFEATQRRLLHYNSNLDHQEVQLEGFMTAMMAST